MKVICVDPRLGDLPGHYFNEAKGQIDEFRRRAVDYELLVSVHAPPSMVAELNAHPVVDDPTFRFEWSFEERSNRFLAMLHEHVDHRVSAGDRVLMTYVTQLEAHALVRWLAELPSAQTPWVVAMFLVDAWNHSDQAEHERHLAEFSKLRLAASSLSPEDATRMIFFAQTESLAADVAGLIGTRVELAPMPLPYPGPRSYTSARLPTASPRVAILGGMRAEKGSYLVTDIVRACRTRAPVEFLIDTTAEYLVADKLERIAHLAEEPGVTAVDRTMTRPEYYSAIAGSHIGVFPYEVAPYRNRTSGVFAEMVAFGKPVVATHGTWLGDQIEAGRAAGAVFDELEPEAIADAILRCATDLESLTQSANAMARAWRRDVSLPAFINLMDATIEERSRIGAHSGRRERT